uniref:Transposase n=1 Tax=Panagrellus redivivus TaxID=6233 RepID=A0A7E4VLL3_PANRE
MAFQTHPTHAPICLISQECCSTTFMDGGYRERQRFKVLSDMALQRQLVGIGIGYGSVNDRIPSQVEVGPKREKRYL